VADRNRSSGRCISGRVRARNRTWVATTIATVLVATAAHFPNTHRKDIFNQRVSLNFTLEF